MNIFTEKVVYNHAICYIIESNAFYVYPHVLSSSFVFIVAQTCLDMKLKGTMHDFAQILKCTKETCMSDESIESPAGSVF